MKKCLIDTNAISLMLKDDTPEKWYRIWSDIRMRRGGLILFEPLVSEIYYQNIKNFGKKGIEEKILWLKTKLDTDEYKLDDNDAILAGNIHYKYHSAYNLSLVNCFLLAIGKRKGATILTTEEHLKVIGDEMGVEVNCIPFKLLRNKC